MPTTNYKSVNSDLDTLFEPIGPGTKIPDVGYKVGSVDISNYYRDVADGTQYGQTGYSVGTPVIGDLGFKFAALGTVPAAIDGTLFATGSNCCGGLGDNSTVNRSSPVQIGLGCWKSVAGQKAFVSTSHGIDKDYRLFSWGCNSNGQLGDGTSVAKSSPVLIGASSWTAVAAGEAFTSAIRADGTLFTWGIGKSTGVAPAVLTFHNLGGGGTVCRCSPVQISSGCFTQISLSESNGYALCCNGTLFAWGYGYPNNDQSVNPTGILTPVKQWNQVSYGIKSGIAIDNDFKLFTWGYSGFGSLGIGTTNCACQFDLNQVGASSWILLGGVTRCNNNLQFATSHGGERFHAIRSDYTLWGFGSGAGGNLGDNSTISKSSPVQVGASSWIAVGNGFTHNLGITSLNRLFAWGCGTCGALGTSATTNSCTPACVGTSSWIAVAAGRCFTAAIRSGGGLFTWGLNTCGVLGSGTTVNRSSPVQVGASSWVAIATGSLNIHAIRSGGGLFSWGAGTTGVLGSGSTASRCSPVQVGASSWIAVNSIADAAHLIRSDYGLFFTGFGANDTNGLGNRTNYSSPIQIGSSSWIIVKSGNLAAIGITSNNCAFIWGDNSFGKLGRGYCVSISGDCCPQLLGNNKYSRIETPTKVTFPGDRSVAIISSGYKQAFAITTDKLLFAWGLAQNGVLGNGSTATSYCCPVQIGASSWTTVDAGPTSTKAIRSDYSLFSWGTGGCGIMGDGTTTGKSSPVQIGSSSWTAVSSVSHTVALRSGGSLFTWGTNNNGQLGLGDITARSSPVQVGSSSFSAIGTGQFHSLFIKKP
jgi:alpha-tubulin suppressor-like RCC1 family protein